MFSASILFCATIFGVVTDRCIIIEDTLGPYVSEASCNIRIEQMLRDISNTPELIANIYLSLEFPQQVAYVSVCLDSV
jgi:hypothetical protein